MDRSAKAGPAQPSQTTLLTDSPEHSASVHRLYDIVNRHTLTTLYQPIVDLSDCTILAHEGLIRGPSDTAFHSPSKLLRTAHELGLGFELETLCARMLTQHFANLGLPGKLFINFSPNVLMKHSLGGEHGGGDWSEGLPPERIVIELIEHPLSAAYGADILLEAGRAYRRKGFGIAIDDPGEGSSKQRLWSELRPDFIKIDPHFVQGIDKDPVKAQFVSSMLEIAKDAGSKLIAEGIETRAELSSLETIGITLGQGYFIGHPLPAPSTIVAAEVVDALRGNRHHGKRRPIDSKELTAIERELLIRVPPASPETTNEEVFLRFEGDPNLLALPVVDDDGRPLGLINRYDLIGCFARPYYHEVYGRKSCRVQMDEHPLMIDKYQSIQELGALLANSSAHHVMNGFLITENQRYLGVGTTQDLVRVITTMQIQAARHANPLTQLPGNVPINESIDEWLRENINFAVCYFDLDHFKPFNDVYGFAKGDDIIKLTGRILTEITDGDQDFIGHIGGDDFIVLFRSEDWEQRCQLALGKFAEGIADYFSPDDRERGGYLAENRRGEMEFNSLTSLSVGAVEVKPGMFASRLELSHVASEAKKKAKAIAGNSLYINKRHYRAGMDAVESTAPTTPTPPSA